MVSRMKLCVVLLLVATVCRGSVMNYRQTSQDSRGHRKIASPINGMLFRSKVPDIKDINQEIPTLGKCNNLLHIDSSPILVSRQDNNLVRKSYNQRYVPTSLNVNHAFRDMERTRGQRETPFVEALLLEQNMQYTRFYPKLKSVPTEVDKNILYKNVPSAMLTRPQMNQDLYRQIRPATDLKNPICQSKASFNERVYRQPVAHDLAKFEAIDFLVEWIYKTNLNDIPVKMDINPSFTDIGSSIDLVTRLDKNTLLGQDPAAVAVIYSRRVLQEVLYKRMQCTSSVLDRYLLELVKTDLITILPSNDMGLFRDLVQTLSVGARLTRAEASDTAYRTTRRVSAAFQRDILKLAIVTTYPDVAELSQTLYNDLLQFFEEFLMTNTQRTWEDLNQVINSAIARCGLSCPSKQSVLARHELAYMETVRFFTDERRRLVSTARTDAPCTCQHSCNCASVVNGSPCNCPCRAFNKTWRDRLTVTGDVEDMIRRYIVRPVANIVEYEKVFIQNRGYLMERLGDVDGPVVGVAANIY